MKNITEREKKIINDFLIEAMKNNHRCQHCCHNHNDTCFFSAMCFYDDMKFFNDEDEDEEVYTKLT